MGTNNLLTWHIEHPCTDSFAGTTASFGLKHGVRQHLTLLCLNEREPMALTLKVPRNVGHCPKKSGVRSPFIKGSLRVQVDSTQVRSLSNNTNIPGLGFPVKRQRGLLSDVCLGRDVGFP